MVVWARLLPVALVIPLVAGCQPGEVSGASAEAPKVAEAAVDPPAKIEATPICLVNKRDVVTVGMGPDAAFRAFQDKRSGGFESEDLPPGFKEPYQARSWEDGQRGFGVIFYNGLVAAAMYQVEKTTVEDVYAMVKEYRIRIADVEPRAVKGSKVNYWFWDLDGQRLMICGYGPSPDDLTLTACMGDDVVLDSLGISYEKALRDEPEVDDVSAIFGLRPHGSAK